MRFRTVVRCLIAHAILAPAILLTDGQDSSAVVVVDFSPDTTGVALLSALRDNEYLLQVIGDEFELAQDTVITGGSIFSDSTVGVVGNAVRFLIFADPNTPPSVNIATTLDAVDTLFTTGESSLTRKHATIAPTLLSAGTYWFAMPGDGFDIKQGTTTTVGDGYDDGDYRNGNGSANIAGVTNGGDMYFQLEAVPEPTVLMLAVTGLGCLLAPRRRR